MASLYLDTTTIIDLAFSGEQRHPKAMKFMSICANNFGEIELVISSWATVEALSVLYRKFLEETGLNWLNRYSNKGFIKAKEKDVRTCFPPMYDLLKRARDTYDGMLSELQETCHVRVISLLQLQGDVIEVAVQLSERTGIQAPDSLHLALALDQLVDYMVISDGDFLSRVRYDKHKVHIHNLLVDRAYPLNPPDFQVHPLRILGTEVMTPKSKEIVSVLESKGYLPASEG